MSGRDVLNPKQAKPMQLPMFMRATDLADSLTGTLDRSWNEPQEVLRQKLSQAKAPLSEAHGSGVYESVKREGVINPVQLVHGLNQSLLMGQGHHRTAVAADIESQTGKDMWLPVVHTEAPVDEVSSVNEKREAIADYRNWSTHTKAIGQDTGWLQSREDALPPRPRMSDFYNDSSGSSSGSGWSGSS